MSSKRLRDKPNYTLVLLFAAFACSFVDRQILSILLEPIRQEMDLSDTQLGFLGGLAFALFYATLGVPIAMLADRSNRKRIITASLVVFSFMTVLCGMAQNFLQLAAARVGVGVGEAGVNPASHSIIADLYPQEKRATAMGFLAIGTNVGMLIGMGLGGVLSLYFGWRVALMTVGLPGLLLACIFWLTVREPARGAADKLEAPQKALPVKDSLYYMWHNRAMRHIVIGSMLVAVSSYGISAWLPSFFIRTHGLSTAQVGLLLAVFGGILGGVGAFLGGYMNDRLAKQKQGRGLLAIALITVTAYPFTVAMYLSPTFGMAAAFLAIPAFTSGMFLGPSMAYVQSLAKLRMRSFAAAIKMMTLNLVGLGIGPQAVGLISDALKPSYGEDSLRIALVIISAVSLWGALHFYLCSKHLIAGLQEAKI